MAELTYISTTEITNYANVSDLKVIILKTLARWFPKKYIFNEGGVESWIQKEGTDIDVLYGNAFQFELSITDENVYKLEMYANGRFRRQCSTCDFFEMIMECLEFQIKYPERDFDTMIDCHEDEEYDEDEEDTVASLDEDDTVAILDEDDTVASLDEDDESDDEDDLIINSTNSTTMNTYTTEELENAFEFHNTKHMYTCSNHNDNSKSVRHQAWINNSNLIKSSLEEYYYYLHNYGTVLTFNRDGDIVCDFDCATGISYSITGSPKILLRIPDFKCKDPLSSREEEEEEEDEDEDEDEDENEDEEEDMPLRNMNDAQIEKYVELRGCCPRDEIYEWAMVYNGGDIIRYSYCNFSQWHIEDQTVSNITITHAIFEQTTFTKYVFDNVTFDECVFKDVILNNTTFKNSKFIDCEFDSSIVPDKSCEVVNYIDDDDDHIHITYY